MIDVVEVKSNTFVGAATFITVLVVAPDISSLHLTTTFCSVILKGDIKPIGSPPIILDSKYPASGK